MALHWRLPRCLFGRPVDSNRRGRAARRRQKTDFPVTVSKRGVSNNRKNQFHLLSQRKTRQKNRLSDGIVFAGRRHVS